MLKLILNVFLFAFLILLMSCRKGDAVREVDASVAHDFMGPVIAAESWAVESGEVKTLRITNILQLDDAQELDDVVFVYGKDRMLEIAARDYYRRLIERAENPGIFWYARGLKGLEILILQKRGEGNDQAYILKVDAVTGVVANE